MAGGASDSSTHDDAGWRAAILAVNDAIDAVVGKDPRSVLRIINAAVFALIIVVCTMLGVEHGNVLERREAMRRALSSAVLEGAAPEFLEPSFIHPDLVVWYRDSFFLMWLGFLALSLAFVFVLNAVMSSAIRAEEIEKRKREESEQGGDKSAQAKKSD